VRTKANYHLRARARSTKKTRDQTGYQISVSRTLPFPASQLFKKWRDKKERSTWLIDDDLAFHTAKVNKTLRGSWKNGKTRVEVGFYPKAKASVKWWCSTPS